MFQVYQYLVSGGSMAEPLAECWEDLPMPLWSAYAYTRGEPEFTNVTPAFTDTLDYILFTPSKGIEPVGYLELPEADTISIEPVFAQEGKMMKAVVYLELAGCGGETAATHIKNVIFQPLYIMVVENLIMYDITIVYLVQLYII